jgi:putative transposase
MKKTYPSDLNKKAWKYMKKRLPKRKNEHSLKWSWRIILNAIFYLQRTGCQWRYLPKTFPPWKTVYHYTRIWRRNGFWEKINTELREYLRVQDGKNAQPSAGSMDTQVFSSTMVGGLRGYNGYKNVMGRKRFLLVDTLGFLLKVKIVPGNWSEKDAAMVGLEGLEKVFPRMELLWADQRPCPSGAFYGQERIQRLGVHSMVERDGEMDARVNEWHFKARQRRFQDCSETLGCRTDDCVVVEQSAVGSEF